jgi:hypothetical protein
VITNNINDQQHNTIEIVRKRMYMVGFEVFIILSTKCMVCWDAVQYDLVDGYQDVEEPAASSSQKRGPSRFLQNVGPSHITTWYYT